MVSVSVFALLISNNFPTVFATIIYGLRFRLCWFCFRNPTKSWVDRRIIFDRRLPTSSIILPTASIVLSKSTFIVTTISSVLSTGTSTPYVLSTATSTPCVLSTAATVFTTTSTILSSVFISNMSILTIIAWSIFTIISWIISERGIYSTSLSHLRYKKLSQSGHLPSLLG